MIRGLYTAVSGLVTQEAKMDVISNNIANVDTTGFKGDDLHVKKFDDVLIQSCDRNWGNNSNKTTIGNLSLGSRIDETTTDFKQGDFQDTGNQTDFAIDGRGFFTLRRNDGTASQTYYSRNGHFHVNSNGLLVNDSGDFLLDSNGNTINVGGNEFNCDENGNLTIANNPNKIKLNIADFNTNMPVKDAYKNLIKIGDNAYKTTDTPQISNATVKQNSLEKSNIDPTTQMVNMISVMRTFESNQKMVQYMDETIGKAVNEVGSIR